MRAPMVSCGSDNLVDHDLGCLQEPIGRGWFNGEAEQGRVDDVGRHEAEGHAAERGEQIRLKDERQARLAAVMSLRRDGDDVAALYVLSQAAISEMKSRAGFSWAERAARRTYLRHSAENPVARVSGTQICTGRRPLRRRRLL